MLPFNINIPYKLKVIYNSISRKVFKCFHHGDDVHCYLCGWKGSNFNKQRCPNCNSLPRHRLIAFSFNYFNLDINQKTLLHIGPNKSEANYIITNYYPRLYLRIDLNRSTNTNIVGDLTKLPLKTTSIDFLITWHVLEHIKNDKAAIMEIYRVLQHGGNAVVSVPIFPPDREETFEESKALRSEFQKLYGHPDHVRACGMDYWKRFESQGFIVNELCVKDLLTPEVIRYGLSTNHVVWCFIKL